jgi:hypothetical protein
VYTQERIRPVGKLRKVTIEIVEQIPEQNLLRFRMETPESEGEIFSMPLSEWEQMLAAHEDMVRDIDSIDGPA